MTQVINIALPESTLTFAVGQEVFETAINDTNSEEGAKLLAKLEKKDLDKMSTAEIGKVLSEIVDTAFGKGSYPRFYEACDKSTEKAFGAMSQISKHMTDKRLEMMALDIVGDYARGID